MSEKLANDRERLWDLVRYQRTELHLAELITDEEYADLVQDGKSRERLECYDCTAARIRKLESANRDLKRLNRDLAACIQDNAKRVFQRSLPAITESLRTTSLPPASSWRDNMLTKAELEEIRASLANLPLGILPDWVSCGIAALLDHIDALERAIEAHKRDEADRAEMERAAYENGQNSA